MAFGYTNSCNSFGLAGFFSLLFVQNLQKKIWDIYHSNPIWPILSSKVKIQIILNYIGRLVAWDVVAWDAVKHMIGKCVKYNTCLLNS